jgi:hypothetical protein
MAKFVIHTRKNGEFQFNLQASNGKIILTSEGYSTRTACQNGIDSVKKSAAHDELYERKSTANEKFHFNLKSKNGQVIGTGQTYESKAGMENGIQSVKVNAADAAVEDA